MKNLINNNYYKTLNLVLVLIFFMQPVIVNAVDQENDTGFNGAPGVLPNVGQIQDTQTITPVNVSTNVSTNNSNNTTQNLSQAAVNNQIQQSIGSVQSSTTIQQTNQVTSSAVGVASCFGSQVLSQAIVKNVSSFASNAAGKVVDSIFNVPVAEGGQTGASIKTDVSARVGTGLDLFGFSIPVLPSWDSMAYCIVNTMIIYIADSTIQWVNTGFEGNPAFLNNPDEFFENLANQEKINFLQNLAYGINSSVCTVNKPGLLSALLSRYGKNQQMYGQGYQNGGFGGQGNPNGALNSCPFDNNPNQLNAFFGVNFEAGGGWGTWFRLTQSPTNNPYTSYFNTVDKLNNQVEAIQISKNRELTWNNGYLSFRKCENGEKDTSRCPITTPGSVVQSQLESTLNLGKNRLVLANKFDQVVTAVVDQLITTSIDKVLDLATYQSSNNSGSGNNNKIKENLWLSTTTLPFYGNGTTSTSTSSSASTTTSF